MLLYCAVCRHYGHLGHWSTTSHPSMSERDPQGPALDERVNEKGAKTLPIESAGVAEVGEVPAAMHRPPTLAPPPGQTFWLCVIHGLRCFGDRAWSFFIPVCVSFQPAKTSYLRTSRALSSKGCTEGGEVAKSVWESIPNKALIRNKHAGRGGGQEGLGVNS